MSERSKYLKFGIAIAIIVVTLAFLAYTGVRDSKSYYVTISELNAQVKQGDAIFQKRLRVSGNVAAGSIKRQGNDIAFTLIEGDKTLPVVYQTLEAPPDTFKDGARLWPKAGLDATASFMRPASRPSVLPSTTRKRRRNFLLSCRLPDSRQSIMMFPSC